MKKYSLVLVVALCSGMAAAQITAPGVDRNMYLQTCQRVKAEKMAKLQLEAVHETEHFTVHYHPERTPPTIAALIGAHAEEIYLPVKDKLRSDYSAKTDIVLDMNTGIDTESVAGYVNSGVIYLPPTINDTTAGTILHEFTHVVVNDLTTGNCPTWLNEGMALLMVESLDNVAYISNDSNLGENAPYTLAALNDFKQLPNKPLAYRQSSLYVRYIIDVHGKEKLLQILNDLSHGKSLPQAIYKRLGLHYQTFGIRAEKWALEFDNEYNL